MKNTIALLLIFSFFYSCNSYKEVPSIVGKKDFEMDVIEREAPYELTIVKDGVSFTNLPPKLWNINRSSKDWDIIVEKYKAEVVYDIDTRNGKTHILRRLTKWPDEETGDISTPENFLKYLEKKGIIDYEITEQYAMDFYKDIKVYFINLKYKEVNNQIRLGSKQISVTSYLLEDETYWRDEGYVK